MIYWKLNLKFQIRPNILRILDIILEGVWACFCLKCVNFIFNYFWEKIKPLQLMFIWHKCGNITFFPHTKTSSSLLHLTCEVHNYFKKWLSYKNLPSPPTHTHTHSPENKWAVENQFRLQLNLLFFWKWLL